MSVVKERRLGRFAIPFEVFDDNEEIVQTVLGTTIVVDAKSCVIDRAVLYTAYCSAFVPVAQGEEISVYDMNLNDEGVVTWAQL